MILSFYLYLIIMKLLILLGLIGNGLCVYPLFNVAPAPLPAYLPAVYPSPYLTQYPPVNQYPYTRYNLAYTAYNPAYNAYNPALQFNPLTRVFPFNPVNAPTTTFSGVGAGVSGFVGQGQVGVAGQGAGLFFGNGVSNFNGAGSVNM